MTFLFFSEPTFSVRVFGNDSSAIHLPEYKQFSYLSAQASGYDVVFTFCHFFKVLKVTQYFLFCKTQSFFPLINVLVFVLRCKGAAKIQAPQKVVPPCYNPVPLCYNPVHKTQKKETARRQSLFYITIHHTVGAIGKSPSQAKTHHNTTKLSSS